MAKVVSNDQQRRTHFEGNEEDARAFVKRSFPHVHVEPGRNYGDEGPQPDVVLVDDDGNEDKLVGGVWTSEMEEYDAQHEDDEK